MDTSVNLSTTVKSKSTQDRKSTTLKPKTPTISIQITPEPVEAKKETNSCLNETHLDTVIPNHTSSPIRHPEPVYTWDYFEKIDLNKRDVKYYRTLVQFNTTNLNNLGNEWNSLCSSGAVPEEIQGDIRSACGLAKLLIDERFSQFSELINQCEQSELNPGELGLLVKCTDLQGFWDMVDVQVKDVTKSLNY